MKSTTAPSAKKMELGAVLFSAFCLLLSSCSDRLEHTSTNEVKTTESAPHFTLRGWISQRELSWGIDPNQIPSELGKAAVRSTLKSALEAWAGSGCFVFTEAEGEADILFGFSSENWSSGGDYLANGLEIARAGPLGIPARVTFNARLDWDTSNSRKVRSDKSSTQPPYSLLAAALHEIGHVLGLDHSNDPRSLMFGAYDAKRLQLSISDDAALHSLYGGGLDAPGDLFWEDGDRKVALLRAVAVPEKTDWVLADLDADGRDEIVIWSLKANPPTFTSYHFDRAKRLVRSRGPRLLPVSDPKQMCFDRTVEGHSVLLRLLAEGRYVAIVFDGSSREGRSWGRGVTLRLQSGLVDADGDGQFEEGWLLNNPVEVRDGRALGTDENRRRGDLDADKNRRRGDLDGDGVLEWVVLSL
ncbi:MAG: matrixin family metalloprotease [Planctomycetota bacterium]